MLGQKLWVFVTLKHWLSIRIEGVLSSGEENGGNFGLNPAVFKLNSLSLRRRTDLLRLYIAIELKYYFVFLSFFLF